MQKIASFIVQKRRAVMIAMLVITVLCGILSFMVNVNEDLTAYLPDDSSMKQGMDIMNSEFPAAETSKTVRVMVTDLTDEQKQSVLSSLESLEYVSYVDYDSTEEHNKDNQTLYIVNTDYAYGSDEEKKLESNIEDTLTDYTFVLRNDDTSVEEIPVYVMVAALAILLAVLFTMCGSWIEPLLFLLTIGIAVIINAGTNILLGSVSNITNMISALLQLVLSMDYSIILMNRYRQELEKNSDREAAMSSALRHAFSSIASSSVTTIVGLLALVFMSFKIGMDLGIVLAKGVLISMLCVFTVLPGIILLCTKLIQKTAKKVPHIPMGGLGRFSHKFRVPVAIAFVVLFVVSCILQNGTQTAFTLASEDPIADVFPTENPVVLVYRNEDDDTVSDLAESLVENDDNVKSATNYSLMLGKAYTADELAGALSAMSGELNLTPELLQILYYDYYCHDDSVTMTAGQFLHFLAEDVITNDMFAEYIDSSMTDKAGLLSEFADAENLTEKKTVSELADAFSMDSELVEKMMILYYTNHGGAYTGTMTLHRFADFVANEVAKNPDYSAMFDSDTLSMTDMLLSFTDASEMTTPKTYKGIADLLGIDEDMARLLFVYYYASQDGYETGAMTMSEFIDLIQNKVANDSALSSYMDESMTSQMSMLSIFTNKDIIEATSAVKLMDILISIAPDSTSEDLQLVQKIMEGVQSGKAYTYTEMASLFGMDADMMKMLYAYRDSFDDSDSRQLSMQTVVHFLVNNKEQFAAALGDNAQQLDMLEKLIDNSVAGRAFTYESLAALVGMDSEQLHQLYLLYQTEHGNTSAWGISLDTFVSFIQTDILSNESYSSQMDEDAAALLTAARSLIDAVLSGKEYNSDELAGLFSGLTDELNANMVGLLTMFYSSQQNYNDDWTLSIHQMFNYIADNMLNDPRFDGVLDDNMRNMITENRSTIEDGIAQLKGENYSRLILSTTYSGESEETSQFIGNLINTCDEKLTGDYYFIGESVMNYEMENTFDSEMLMITLITAISIFIVVALTFRSFIIPLILVLIVQCGVYITVAIIGFQGYSIYYLALLIVQSILMGATIDYGILYTNYYLENRRTRSVKDALTAAYNGSVHTILTSGSILVLVTGIVGNLFSNPTIGQICKTISIGALSASLLILFLLPGILAVLDRLIIRKKKTAKK